ncbi:MAG TPA: hypothetical protein DEA08_13975 [Planctomycetes bacterium]|nr:hypothetical protein [Planctomycetota bacterium]
MLASDVMTTPVRTLTEDCRIKQLVDMLRPGDFGGYPVVSAAGQVVGLVSQTDSLRALACAQREGDFSSEFAGLSKRPAIAMLLDMQRGPAATTEVLLQRPIRDIMSSPVISCGPHTPLSEVCQLMSGRSVNRVVVLDGEDKPIGIISASDLVSALGRLLGDEG